MPPGRPWVHILPFQFIQQVFAQHLPCTGPSEVDTGAAVGQETDGSLPTGSSQSSTFVRGARGKWPLLSVKKQLQRQRPCSVLCLEASLRPRGLLFAAHHLVCAISTRLCSTAAAAWQCLPLPPLPPANTLFLFGKFQLKSLPPPWTFLRMMLLFFYYKFKFIYFFIMCSIKLYLQKPGKLTWGQAIILNGHPKTWRFT